MATVKYSPLVADVRGSAADVTFAAWKGRGYIRRKVTPSNPQSVAQTAVREAMGRLAALWRSLTAVVKTAQNTYATSYRMSGWNWFCQQNRVLEETYLAGKLTPPNTEIDPPATFGLADSGGGTCAVTWTGGTVGADYKMYVWSRKIEALDVEEAFTLESADAVLASAGTVNITIAASKDSQVIAAIHKVSDDTFSECVADQITMGA